MSLIPTNPKACQALYAALQAAEEILGVEGVPRGSQWLVPIDLDASLVLVAYHNTGMIIAGIERGEIIIDMLTHCSDNSRSLVEAVLAAYEAYKTDVDSAPSTPPGTQRTSTSAG